MTLYSDGERYFLVPPSADPPPGPVWMTSVAGEERTMDAAWAAAFEVDEATADAFVAREVEAVVGQVLPALARFLVEASRAPAPEVALVLRGLMDALAAAARGDEASTGRFQDRCDQVASGLSDPALAEAVRAMPSQMRRLVGRG